MASEIKGHPDRSFRRIKTRYQKHELQKSVVSIHTAVILRWRL